MLELATTLLHSLWQATVLAGLLWLVSRHRGLSAAFRYRLAYGTLLGQLALSVGTYLHYRTPAPRLEGEVKQLVIDWVAATPSGGPVDYTTPTYWLHALVLVWVVSVVVGTLRTAISFGRVRRMKSRSVPLTSTPGLDVIDRLAQRIGYTGTLSVRVAAVAAPLLAGFFRPVLLLPVALANQLTTEEAEAVLLHELAHLRRHDHWWNLLQCTIEILFYYHPAVHWIGARIREEREYCCDDWVLAYGPSGLPYARALLHYGEQAAARNVTALSLTDGGGLLARVQRFLTNQTMYYRMKKQLLLLPLLTGLVLVATATYTPEPKLRESRSSVDTPLTTVPVPSDTLPTGKHEVTRISNGKTDRVRVEDGEIKALELDGRVIPPEKYEDYEGEAEELLGVDTPPFQQRWRSDTTITLRAENGSYSADTVIELRTLSRSGEGEIILRGGPRLTPRIFQDMERFKLLEADSLLQLSLLHHDSLTAGHLARFRSHSFDLDSLAQQLAWTSQERLGPIQDSLLNFRFGLPDFDSLQQRLSPVRPFDDLPFFERLEEVDDVEELNRREQRLREQLERLERRREELKGGD